MQELQCNKLINYFQKNYDQSDVITDRIIKNVAGEFDIKTYVFFEKTLKNNIVDVNDIIMQFFHYFENFDRGTCKNSNMLKFYDFVKKLHKSQLTGYIHGNSNRDLFVPDQVSNFYISDVINLLKSVN